MILVLIVVLFAVPAGLRLSMLGHQAPPAQIKAGETLYFYRDDCKACQRDYPKVIWEKITGKKIIMINTNGPANQELVTKYNITEVPNKAQQR